MPGALARSTRAEGREGVPHEDFLPKIFLASTSPRRAEIMGGVENMVEVLAPNALEGPSRPGETAVEYVARLAFDKAASAEGHASDGVVLAADTTVALGDRLFGKPRTQDEARDMLERLRDRNHSVVTGVSVRDLRTGTCVTEVRESAVEMRAYTAGEIDRYLSTDAPLDRAGAYGVQDRCFGPVKAVEGCYLNVVGLPLCTVVKLVEMIGGKVALRQPDQVPYLSSCLRCELECRLDRRPDR